MDRAGLAQLLQQFGISADITRITPHITYNGLDQQPPAYKLVTGLSFEGHPSLVIKCLKEERTNAAYLREQYLLSSLFLRHGIPTARRMLTPEGREQITTTHQGHQLLVTLERDIGPEISLATLALCRQAGELLGRMHQICMAEGFHMAEGRAIFDWMRESDVDAGNMLIDLLQRHGRNPESQAVRALYDARRDMLKSRWRALPHFAVHGDLSINNLVWGAQGELKVFDYNCAGEAPLISDAVLQALLFAREMPYDPTQPPSSWDTRFVSFFEGYKAQRPLTEAEKSVFEPLYQAADAFWFTRYFYGDDTLDKALEEDPALPLDGLVESIAGLLLKKPPL